jgi:hypothetical protein
MSILKRGWARAVRFFIAIDDFFDRRIKEHIGDDEEEAAKWQSIK